MPDPAVSSSESRTAADRPETAPEVGIESSPTRRPGLRQIGRQSALNITAAVLAGVYSIWLTSFLLGTLGPAPYGTWATVTAFLTPLLVLDAGLGLLVVRASASHGSRPEDAAAEASTAHGLYLGLGMVGLVGGILLGLLPGPLLGLTGEAARDARTAAWILAADFAIVIGTSALPALLRGRQRYGAIVASSLFQVIVGAAFSVALVPALGLIGAAVAQLLSHLTARLAQLVLVWRLVPWFSPVPRRPKWRRLRQVAMFSGPLLMISLGSQISFSTDVIVVGGIVGAEAASWIAVGARLPILAVALLSVAVDVLFPVFVAEERLRPDVAPRLFWRALAAAGVLGGGAFLFLASARKEILDLWLPGWDPIAGAVFALYCLAWAVHMPAHVVALVIIAQSRHSVMAPIVLAESLANLALSIVLVIRVGPVGAALGSFIAVSVSNAIVLPLVARWRMRYPLVKVVLNSAGGLVLGGLAAALGFAIVEAAGLAGLERLLVQAVATGLAGLASLAVVWAPPGPLRRSTETSPAR